jgi:hypothetical protein
MNDSQNSEGIQLIRRSLEDRDTAELLEIWQKNDPGEWSPEAFQAIREILIERIGSVPDQQAREPEAQGEVESESEPESEPDTYYERKNMIRLASRAKNLSVVVIVLFGLILIAVLISFLPVLLAPFSQPQNFLIFLITLLVAFSLCAFFWIVLQVIGEGAYLLMDIEENTRLAMDTRAKDAR